VEYAVLVTNSSYPLESMAQLYRDRATRKWIRRVEEPVGWGGFTNSGHRTLSDQRPRRGAIYNWWSWYCRAAKPEARMGAITSRALLLASVGRATSMPTNDALSDADARRAHNPDGADRQYPAALSHVRRVAEQFPGLTDGRPAELYRGQIIPIDP